MTFKIQKFDPKIGWVNLTRAGPTKTNARATLSGYKRDYPSQRHRLVEVKEDERLEIYSVIPDDDDE